MFKRHAMQNMSLQVSMQGGLDPPLCLDLKKFTHLQVYATNNKCGATGGQWLWGDVLPNNTIQTSTRTGSKSFQQVTHKRSSTAG